MKILKSSFCRKKSLKSNFCLKKRCLKNNFLMRNLKSSFWKKNLKVLPCNLKWMRS